VSFVFIHYNINYIIIVAHTYTVDNNIIVPKQRLCVRRRLVIVLKLNDKKKSTLCCRSYIPINGIHSIFLSIEYTETNQIYYYGEIGTRALRRL